MNTDRLAIATRNAVASTAVGRFFGAQHMEDMQMSKFFLFVYRTNPLSGRGGLNDLAATCETREEAIAALSLFNRDIFTDAQLVTVNTDGNLELLAEYHKGEPDARFSGDWFLVRLKPDGTYTLRPLDEDPKS